MTILDEIIAFKKAPNGLKDRAIAYITDMTVPLSVRWAVFKEMPDDWKVEESYIQHFDAEKLLGGKISWYDDFYTEKYETVDMVGFVEENSCRNICSSTRTPSILMMSMVLALTNCRPRSRPLSIPGAKRSFF